MTDDLPTITARRAERESLIGSARAKHVQDEDISLVIRQHHSGVHAETEDETWEYEVERDSPSRAIADWAMLVAYHAGRKLDSGPKEAQVLLARIRGDMATLIRDPTLERLVEIAGEYEDDEQ